MYYTPELPTTIISNDSIAKIFPNNIIVGTNLKKDYINNTFLFTLYNKNVPTENIEIQGNLIKGSCYTLPLILPTSKYNHNMICNSVESCKLNKLDTFMERRLWHQRLNHCSDFYLNNAHLSIDGVPKFRTACPIMDACPICLAAKMKSIPTNNKNIYSTTEPWEYIYIWIAVFLV